MSKKIFSFVFSLILLLALFDCAWTTQFTAGDNLYFPSEKTIDDDLMAAGGKIKFDANLSGDLMVAASSIVQNGTIDGNFMAAAQNIDISGQIKRSSRTFSQYLNIDSFVGQNLMAFCQKCNLKPKGYVGKDLYAFCSELNVDGQVGRNLKGLVVTAIISGTVGGDVNIQAERLVLLPTAKIKGTLTYRSPYEADIQKGASISGKAEWKKIEPKKKGGAPGRFILKRFLSFLGFFILGLILIPIFKERTQSVKANLKSSFFKSLWMGFVFLICVFMLFIISFILSFFIIGIPLAILSFAVFLSMFFLCKIAAGLALGDWLLTQSIRNGYVSPILALMVGLFIITILTSIPYFIGSLIYLAILFLGTGAIVYVKRKVV